MANIAVTDTLKPHLFLVTKIAAALGNMYSPAAFIFRQVIRGR